MRKRVKIALIILLFAVVGMVVWRAARSSEPVYQGKQLSRWLDEAFWTGGPNTQMTTAIQSMGTNALPTLLKMINSRDSRFRSALVMYSRRPSRVLFRVHSAQDYHWMAMWGFNALGPTGKPALPALINLLNHGDEDARAAAAYCLGVIGPAKEAVPALTQCLKD